LEETVMTPSPESQLTRQIEDLVRKLAFSAGTGSERTRDLARLKDLQRERAEMMRPKVLKKRKLT